MRRGEAPLRVVARILTAILADRAVRDAGVDPGDDVRREIRALEDVVHVDAGLSDTREPRVRLPRCRRATDKSLRPLRVVADVERGRKRRIEAVAQRVASTLRGEGAGVEVRCRAIE